MSTFSQIKDEIYEDFSEEYTEEFDDLVREENRRSRTTLLRRIVHDTIEFTLSHPSARDVI